MPFLPQPPEPTKVSTKRAAEILEVSERTIRRYIETGELIGIRRGKKDWMVYTWSIHEFQRRNLDSSFKYD